MPSRLSLQDEVLSSHRGQLLRLPERSWGQRGRGRRDRLAGSQPRASPRSRWPGRVSAGASRRDPKGPPGATPNPQVHEPSGLSLATDQRCELFFLTARPTLGRSPVASVTPPRHPCAANGTPFRTSYIFLSRNNMRRRPAPPPSPGQGRAAFSLQPPSGGRTARPRTRCSGRARPPQTLPFRQASPRRCVGRLLAR